MRTACWDEWLALMLAAEIKAKESHDFTNAGWRAYHAGWVYSLRDQSAEVLACADRAASHCREAKNPPRLKAYAIRLRGIGHELSKDYTAAMAAYRNAIEIWKTIDIESDDVAKGLNDLAEAERLSGDYSAAEDDYREALRIAKAIGDQEGVAIFTGNIAEVALARENWLEAERLSREALLLAETVGRQQLIASDNFRIAKALARQSRRSEGLHFAQVAVKFFTSLRSPRLEEARKLLQECQI